MQPKKYDLTIHTKTGLKDREKIELTTEDFGMNVYEFKLTHGFDENYDLTGVIPRLIVDTPITHSKVQADMQSINAIAGICSLTLLGDMFCEVGTHSAEVQLWDEATNIIRLTFPRFTYVAKKSLQDETTVEANENFSLLQGLVADANTALGEIGDFASQLATKVTQVNGVSPINGNVTIEIPQVDVSTLATKIELTNAVSPKADKSYVDTLTSSIASGSPKDVFPTLELLQANATANTADGKKSIYLVTADEKWYRWNGSVWIAGGVYQSSTLDTETQNKVDASSNFTTKYYTENVITLSDITPVYATATYNDNILNVPIASISGGPGGFGYCFVNCFNSFEFKILDAYGSNKSWAILSEDATKYYCIGIIGAEMGKRFTINKTTQAFVFTNTTPAYSLALNDIVRYELFENQIVVFKKISSEYVALVTLDYVGTFKTGFLVSGGSCGNVARDIKDNKDILFRESFLDTSQKWNGKKAGFIGDSITWLDQYPKTVQRVLGLESYYNWGLNGEILKNLYLAIDANYTPDVDAITVFGGTNDWYISFPFGTVSDVVGTDTTCGYIRAICEKLITLYPDKTIVFITILQRWGYTAGVGENQPTTDVNNAGVYLYQYSDAVKSICKEYAIPVLDLFAESGITRLNINTWTYDGLHPNAAGMEKIGYKIAKFIEQY